MTQSNKIKIAITGGYASGKSSVAKIFKKKGFSCFSADEIYSELKNNQDFVRQIYDEISLPPKMADGNVIFDRDYIGDNCFTNKEKLSALNAFTHKAVYREINRIFERSNQKFVVFEIPLLFEDNKSDDFDIVILVLRDIDKRIQSGAKRDNLTAAKARQRIENQVDHKQFIEKAHYVIHNDEDFSYLEIKCQEIIEKITNEKTDKV